MILDTILRVSIVGSGNVATHLAAAIAQSEHKLQQILSRNTTYARILAQSVNAQSINQIIDLKESDIIILAIKDEALKEEYIKQFPQDAIICHTSGSVPIDLLKRNPNHGIFYPLQTFSKQKMVDFSQIPICLEASNEKVMKTLHRLAKSISQKVYEINSEQRKALHLSAVFACNFSNLMYDISEQLCEESGVDFNILRPLIQETAVKVQDHLPSEVQTGPAARNDKKIIEKHLQLLNHHSDFQNIYKILTDEIMKNNEEL